MSEKIAVYLNNDGITTSLMESGIVKVYFKEKGNWKVIQEINLSIDSTKGLRAVREQLISMAESLEDCKIFVGSEVIGAAYTVLDSKGFNTWEVEGEPQEFLDYVLEKEVEESKAEAKTDGKSVNFIPKETNLSGCYTFDLKELQEKDNTISSKQALLPFLKKGGFYELEVTCSHIPPWFERELGNLNYEFESSNIKENLLSVKIFRKVCGGCSE